MAASGSLANVQLASTPGTQDLSFYNAGTTAIPAFTAVVLDTANIMESTDLPLNMIPVVIAGATDALVAFVTREIIPAKKTGRCFGVGSIAIGIASGTVTVNTYVGTSSGTAGTLETATAVNPYLGLALATAATGELFPFLFTPGTSV